MPPKPLDSLEIALSEGLNPSIRQVSDPAGQPFNSGRLVCEEPVTHALHPSTHYELSGYEHRHSISPPARPALSEPPHRARVEGLFDDDRADPGLRRYGIERRHIGFQSGRVSLPQLICLRLQVLVALQDWCPHAPLRTDDRAVEGEQL